MTKGMTAAKLTAMAAVSIRALKEILQLNPAKEGHYAADLLDRAQAIARTAIDRVKQPGHER